MVSENVEPGGSPPDEGEPQSLERTAWSLPAGHEMPDGYDLRRDGIFQVVPRTDREGNPVEPKYVRVSYGPLAVVRKYASADGEQWFDLAWHESRRRTTMRRVSGATLRSGVRLVRELGALGIPLFEGNAGKAEQYLAGYLVANTDPIEESTVKIARVLGWQSDGTFVSSDGAPCPVEVAHTEQKPILAAYHPAGTLKQWQTAIAPVKHYPVVRIVLAAAFAPALFNPLGLRSCTVDVSGRSTRGKSTAAGVGLSVWANPTPEFQAWGTWKSGMIGIEKRLNLMRGLPVVLDETRVVKYPDIVDQVLYQVPMDQGTSRGGNYTALPDDHATALLPGINLRTELIGEAAWRDRDAFRTGRDSLNLLARIRGRRNPWPTDAAHQPLVVTTPSGGTHLWYRAPDDVTLHQALASTGRGLAWKVDVKAGWSYGIAPGATTAAGTYTITADAPATIGRMPDWLAHEVMRVAGPERHDTAAATRPATSAAVSADRGTRYLLTVLDRGDKQLRNLDDGRKQRLAALAYQAGGLIHLSQLTEREVIDRLTDIGTSCGLPPRRAENIARSSLANGQRRPLAIRN